MLQSVMNLMNHDERLLIGTFGYSLVCKSLGPTYMLHYYILYLHGKGGQAVDNMALIPEVNNVQYEKTERSSAIESAKRRLNYGRTLSCSPSMVSLIICINALCINNSSTCDWFCFCFCFCFVFLLHINVNYCDSVILRKKHIYIL